MDRNEATITNIRLDDPNLTISSDKVERRIESIPDFGDTIYPTSKKARKASRPLYGSLTVSGRNWISVNIGLLMIICQGCDGKAEIDNEASFSDFQACVSAFADSHKNCGKCEMTARS